MGGVEINKKIMALIYSDKENYLLLRTNPEWLDVDSWFVVTGGVDGEEGFEQAVEREVDEETGLEILEIKKTAEFFEYEWPKGSGKMHHEKVFLVKVREAVPVLSGEHLEYKWLKKEDFLNEIDWEGSKEKLAEVLDGR